MTTLIITRRKQAVGFMLRMTVKTKEGETILLKTGQTAILKTDHPEALWVKKIMLEKRICTGISSSEQQMPISLELFYDLSNRKIIGLFMGGAILLMITFVQAIRQKMLSEISVAIFIILIAVLIRRSLTIKKV